MDMTSIHKDIAVDAPGLKSGSLDVTFSGFAHPLCFSFMTHLPFAVS
jgi:hypothetical protein